ncbi:sarcosine oxidase subunit beta family protein [Brevibacterium daeguense]|uniref:Sarcosine oxidase subunit beta n=1 Tax=Brevibacterium daeguense TaxID=909936 RepID=A0ABP8EH37_9MICO|nr:sarcosine oxidase subunit beta family protein [Brevibacterium daeguense]
MAQPLPEHPDFLWRNPEPKSSYDAVIIGAGGHGLATAYYLAKDHGLTNIAVLERGWLAGGNMARNTAIIRSNYLWDESAGIYEFALRLWEELPAELDYDFLFSQRGVLNLAHTLQEVRDGRRRVNANVLNGVDAEWLTPDQVKEACPIINTSTDLRYPVLGATYQARGGIAKHDHVAWALARRCDEMGVDLIQNCEVYDILTVGGDSEHPRGDGSRPVGDGSGGRVVGVETALGRISTGTVGMAVAGSSWDLAQRAGVRLPIQSRPLQALVSELFEPVHPIVVMSNHVHVYVSQAHKGELVMGAGVDGYNGFGQRGSFHVIEEQMAAAVELFPIFARAHVLRTWGGVVDVTLDASPIISPTPVEGLYVNCGWGTGGFKGTPAAGCTFAHTIATGQAHPLNAPFTLDRFETGHLIDEHGAAAVAH